MGSTEEEKQMHSSAINMTQAAEKINQKLKDQSLVIEEIKKSSSKNMESFTKNSELFGITLDDVDGDYRNKLMLLLFLVIIVLIFYLRL